MKREDFIKKLSAFSIGPIVGAFINLITTPIITYFISPDEYGKASMFTVALTIIQLVVFLGMDQAYAKRYFESNNKSGLFVNAIIPSLFLTVICEVVGVILFHQIGLWLFNSIYETICVIALLAAIPASVIERFLLLSIRMSQRGKLYSCMSILSKLIILFSTVLLFLLFEKSYRSVVVGMAVSQIIYVMILYVLQRKEINISGHLICFDEIVSLLRFSLPLVPTTIIGWILTGMDKVMLRTYVSYEDLGLYGVAAKFAAGLTIIQACFTTFWSPLAFQWNHEGGNEHNFTKVGKMLSCIMAIVFAFTIMFKDVFFLLLQKEYRDAASIVPFLLFTPIMYTISEVTVMGIYFKEKTSWTIVASTVSATINLLLNMILIPRLGPKGAAIATGISYISFFWLRTILSRRIWYPFTIKPYLFITIILVLDSLVSTFCSGYVIYTVNLACAVLLLLFFRHEVAYLAKLAKDTLKSIVFRT